MRALVTAVILALSISSVTHAQTKTPETGGAYSAFTTSVLDCLAEAHGERRTQMQCLATVVEECMSKAGFYEACLHAAHGALADARDRVEAEARKPCFGGLDPACTLFVIGEGLIASGTTLDAETWAEAVKGEAE